MYPHHKLDWHLSRLEGRLTDAPDDAATRLDFAEHCLSKARFHDGGEPWYNRALTQAKRVLGNDPGNVGAQVIAGLSLVGLERIDPATRYLDQALKSHHDRADVHFALGAMHRAQGDLHQGVRELEIACRLAPESFETHHALALLLWARARQIGMPKRLVERSQFHTARALELDPTLRIASELRFHLAMTALHTNRWAEAHKMLTLLGEHDRYRDKVKFSLGVASYHLGKYKNAILYLRQHLERAPEDPKVHARIGMAYLQLGELDKARTACRRALAVEPHNTEARWTLGCALLEQGQTDEAAGILKELLQDAPDHVPAFSELVALRKAEPEWIEHALRAEVSGFDRLPVQAVLEGPDGKRSVTPRAATRNRVAILLDALSKGRNDPTPVVLSAMALTTDEGLRFLLFEAMLEYGSEQTARTVVSHLQEPGVRFDAEVAMKLLSVTQLVPDELVTKGLHVAEEDLNRAAVDRHGPASDLRAHRKRIEDERQGARAWQALLLLAVGQRGSEHGRNLLVRWAAEADSDLKLAAQCALALLGDTEVISHLRNDSRRHRAERHVEGILAGLAPPSGIVTPRPVTEGDAHCATCGRRAPEVGHLLTGAEGGVCDRCMHDIATQRRSLAVDDPASACSLCRKTNTQVRAVYDHQGATVCSDCVDRSLGLVEREAVDRFFVQL